MKKIILLFVSVLLLNCGGSDDNSSDDDSSDDAITAGNHSIDNDITLITDNGTHTFNFVQTSEDDSYRYIAYYDTSKSSVSLTIRTSYVLDSSRDIEKLSIDFSDGSSAYSYSSDEELEEGNPQNVSYTILEDNDERFNIAFNGVFKSSFGVDSVINIEEFIVDIKGW